MPIYFSNNEPLDLDFIRIMGMSAKDDDAIGYFGTGLKYAIAILLREHQSISLTISGEQYTFTTRPATYRGKHFNLVYMNDEKLPFTTDLGTNWELWMAYREIYSNCLDEGGTISTEPPSNSPATLITLSGRRIEEVHESRADIFLTSPPLFTHEKTTLHEKRNDFIYYKGVRVQEVNNSIYTYNITSGMSLTEDRTLGTSYTYRSYVSDLIRNLTDRAKIISIITNKDCWETRIFSTYGADCSTVFLDECENQRRLGKLAEPFVEFLQKHRPTSLNFAAKDLTPYETKRVIDACAICTSMGLPAEPRDFTVSDELPTNLLGVYEPSTEKIYISTAALELGDLHLAATIYEELLHKTKEIPDYSREFQDHLLQKLAHFAAEKLYAS